MQMRVTQITFLSKLGEKSLLLFITKIADNNDF